MGIVEPQNVEKLAKDNFTKEAIDITSYEAASRGFWWGTGSNFISGYYYTYYLRKSD